MSTRKMWHVLFFFLFFLKKRTFLKDFKLYILVCIEFVLRMRVKNYTYRSRDPHVEKLPFVSFNLAASDDYISLHAVIHVRTTYGVRSIRTF